MKQLACKTIGHSNHDLDTFVRILRAHGINCIVDVRSAPYSKHNPQFNRESLKDFLKSCQIDYIYMGDCLGARHSARELLFSDGKVDFGKVRQQDFFKSGITRLISGIEKGFNVAIMCSEKDPFECHRFVLVSMALKDRHVEVSHILSAEACVSQEELENKLLDKYFCNHMQPSLFESVKSTPELLDEAYEQRNRDIAYNPYDAERNAQ